MKRVKYIYTHTHIYIYIYLHSHSIETMQTSGFLYNKIINRIENFSKYSKCITKVSRHTMVPLPSMGLKLK